LCIEVLQLQANQPWEFEDAESQKFFEIGQHGYGWIAGGRETGQR
jgi:hypothetical protein